MHSVPELKAQMLKIAFLTLRWPICMQPHTAVCGTM